jgi:predicted DsbA family dithiol-disulfide isomerase
MVRMSPVPQSEVNGPDPRRDGGATVIDWWCDLACSECTDSLEINESLRDRFGDRIVIRLRHFPLTHHVWAVAAAQCQCEAAVQGLGEAYAAQALATIDAIDGPADYIELADHLGLDSDEVAESLFDGRHARTVRADHDSGRALGVVGTPTWVVDGWLIDGSATLDGALAALESRLVRALAT